MDASGVRYERVWIAAWDARSAAGDAAGTWAAIRDRIPQLEQDPHHGWLGRALLESVPDAERLERLALAAAAGPAAGVRGQVPLLALAASKGDTGRLLRGLDPLDLVAALPGGLNAVLARQHGWTCYREAVPVAACSTGLYALLAAADAIEHGQAEQALCGTADASLQPLLLAGFRSLGVIARQRPEAFTERATGFAPGEGAAAFRLERSGPGWRLLAGVRLGDASHPTSCLDPAVLRRCLELLWAACPEPEAIVTHGTGTAIGDAYETAGLDAGPWRSAERMACKPLIGHCLGASSAVELAACLHGPWRRIWKLGLGFGGHVAAVALGR